MNNSLKMFENEIKENIFNSKCKKNSMILKGAEDGGGGEDEKST